MNQQPQQSGGVLPPGYQQAGGALPPGYPQAGGALPPGYQQQSQNNFSQNPPPPGNYSNSPQTGSQQTDDGSYLVYIRLIYLIMYGYRILTQEEMLPIRAWGLLFSLELEL
jgi:hypothetical protein